MTTYVAIDIGQEWFDVCFRVGDTRQEKRFRNSGPGMKEFGMCLKMHRISEVHIFMEATGRYGDELAAWAFDRGWRVTIINPRRTRKFAESKGLFNKTDRIDAACILDYADAMKPSEIFLWKPRSKAHQALKDISMEIAGIEKMISQERNRSKSGVITADVMQTSKRVIAFLAGEKKRLEKRALELIKDDWNLNHNYKILIKIKGIGPKTSITLLAKVRYEEFAKGRQVVCFAGLAPQKWESGKSRKKEIISRVGHADLRSAMYLPAIVAMTHDPEMAQFKAHLERRGKPRKVIICAIMAKLLRKTFAMIRDARKTQLDVAA